MNHPGLRWRWLALLLLPSAAGAHFFTQPYTLPVPFAMYAFGATAALLLSFVIVGVFATVPVRSLSPGGREAVAPAATVRARVGWGLRIGRVLGVFLLALCIVTGLVGVQNPFANFSMTFFWIVFVLGVAYTVALIGDFYAALNPWKTLVEWCERIPGVRFAGREPYPEALGY